jgi:UDP-N-acetylmuramyl pentapeptide phosphotransferase/UDP-N-acetylglucosamine-1-phosphate transferase
MSSVGVGIQFGLFVGAFAASVLGVAVFRKWSHRRELFDVPNARSSHTIPTPRGGGVAIVVVCLTLYLFIGQIFGLSFSWGYFLGALLVAAVSWLDDLYSLPFWSRLLVHIGAAAILINDLGFWSEFSVPLTSKTLSIGSTLGVLITAGWIVWLLNAYNFMDGIDGIAGLQATIAGLGWTILALLLHLDATFLLSGIVAAASAGFWCITGSRLEFSWETWGVPFLGSPWRLSL